MVERAIVTGGAGFIGSHVVESLLEHNCEVLVVDDLSGGREDNVPSGAQLEVVSVLSPLDELFKKFAPKWVFHLAAYAAEGLSHHIPVFNFENNVVATANVLSSAFRADVRHFTFTSSIAVYGHPQDAHPFTEKSLLNPCDPYGIAKTASEQLIRCFHSYYGAPDFTIFRPHNVFGPRQNVRDPYRNVVGIFMARIMDHLPMPIFGDGTQTRSFSGISPVATAIAEAPTVSAARNTTVNIGEDERTSVNELATYVAEAFGVPAQVERLPARAEVAHAHCIHNFGRELFPDAYARSLPIRVALAEMASFVRSRQLPLMTPCPSPIEIRSLLPQSWAALPQGRQVRAASATDGNFRGR